MLTRRKLTRSRKPFAFIILLALLFSVTSFAANPNWPNGPDEDPRLEPPDDNGFSNKWNFFSYIPDESLSTIRPAEIPLGSGIHADRAWQVTTGSPEVVIAVLDSGINWDSWDLINKFYINRGEVPLPEGASEYDANADGAFDIRDYAGDSRVYDINGNSRIEPGDLILIFSDGIDDDGNGYIDDISGWDFMKHDNNPADDTRYGHGTGEARGAAAEVNNGSGHLGVCPDCLIMPVRVSDSFIGDTNHFAQAVIFSVDTGAQVILEALGVLNNTPFARDAVEYAVNSGVSIAASAADENSFHHNFPANYNRTIHTNNVLLDTDGDRSIATTYMALDACTNWGPKITVSASSPNCSSGATSMMAGALGMIYSRALELDLDPPLSSAEVFALVTNGAIDVYDPDSETDVFKYKSRLGWDKFFGHGRLNVRASVDLVTPTDIPPEAWIDSPQWFELVDPDSLISVYGFVDAPRAASYEYRLEAQRGLEPTDRDWVVFENLQALTGATDGLLGVIDPSQLPEEKAIRHDVTDHNAILVRLVVTDAAGNETLYYHSFFAYTDPDWADGFPINLQTSGEASTVMYDLDGDGVYELIVPTAAGQVHAYQANGWEPDGWPVSTALLPGQDPAYQNYLDSAAYQTGQIDPDRRQAIQLGVAVGDANGDGSPQIAAATLDGEVYLWNADGSLAPGFPVFIDPANSATPGWEVEYGIFAAPVLFDLDADTHGDLEIIVTAMDQWVYAWHHDGTPVSGWPVLCRDEIGQDKNRIISAAAVGDINGDGMANVIVTTNEIYDVAGRMYALYREGNGRVDGPFLPGWPVEVWSMYSDFLPYVGRGTTSSPVLFDTDGDGAVEAVINTGVGVPIVFGGNGQIERILNPIVLNLQDGTREPLMVTLNSNYSIGDLQGDGRPAIITGGIGATYGLQALQPGLRIPSEQLLGAWYADNGRPLPYWPQITEDMQMTNAHAIADINDDGLPEVISSSGGHYVHAYDFYGNEPAGWPKFTGGWSTGTPSVGDMDGDGLLEVAIMTREGYLFVWDTTGPANGNIQWSSFAHDPQNTGNYHSPLPTQEGPPIGDDDDDNTDDDDATDDDDNDTTDDDDTVEADDDTTAAPYERTEIEEESCCG